MIKIFLKYKIFEYCIDVIFKALHKNFINRPKIPKVGDYYREIMVERILPTDKKESYRECIVTHVSVAPFMNEGIYRIGIKPKGAEKSMICYWLDGEGFLM